jgi:triosephosphate isomerase
LGKIVAGNWKMNGSSEMMDDLLTVLRKEIPAGFLHSGGVCVVCPPFPYLAQAQLQLAGSKIALGAQNLHPGASGAYTGEVSAPMLKEFGVTWCLVGHSERRHVLGDSDAFIRRKLESAIENGLRPVLCVGETLAERQSGQQKQMVDRQLIAGLVGLPESALGGLSVAYEPVWAIGTGHTASPEQAAEMHAHIREWLRGHISQDFGQKVPLLYGGSVNPGNAHDLLGQPNVDGVLAGGASLKADQFLGIIAHAS